MDKKNKIKKIKAEYNKVRKTSDKYSLRFWVAEKSVEIGYGGIKILCEITGLSRKTIFNWREKLSLKKNNPDNFHYSRKPGSGRPAKIKYAEIKKTLNDILKIEEARAQNLSMCYSSLGSRELTSKLKDAGISISHASMITLLRKQGFFVYGINKNNNGNPRIARKIHLKQIHRNTTHFHQSNNPVIFIDIQKYSPAVSSQKPESNNTATGKEQANLLSIILKWWNDVGSKKYLNSTEILIFINGGPLKIRKVVFKKFIDSTKLQTTFCYIPAGITKWFNIESKVFSESMSIRQNGKKTYCKVSIYIIPKPENLPSNIFAITQSFMAQNSSARRRYNFSPPEWYYTLRPVAKESLKEYNSDKDSEIIKKTPAKELESENHKNISNDKLADVILDILKEYYEFNKIQTFSYSTLGINKISEELKIRKISATNTEIVDILQNEISCVIYRHYKGDKRYSYAIRKQQFELIRNCAIRFQLNNHPAVFVDVSKDVSNSTNNIERNKETEKFLFSCLKEWWGDNKHKSDFSGCSKILIMIHGASSSSAKNIFQEFSNLSNLIVTMCHIPAGILKVRVINELSKKIKSPQYIVNVGVLDKIKPKKVKNEGKSNLEITQEKYTPPPEWYYSLIHANEEDKT